MFGLDLLQVINFWRDFLNIARATVVFSVLPSCLSFSKSTQNRAGCTVICARPNDSQQFTGCNILRV
jgi:hypothetical protein